ncbi:SIS domain-containing protein [Fodinicola feengrottensis]|uniref:SIS domain-containing protein n=1 Tax=Fodinicola feengrottensis TaxID=435914 RepID=A0ABN2GEK2_9ACTN
MTAPGTFVAERLDDPASMHTFDSAQLLRGIAGAGAQLREASQLTAEAGLQVLGDEGRPRAVVVAGVGTAARTADILAAVAGPRCPVPVLAHRSAGIPGWVGAADVVIAVSASGRGPEALAAADAAAARGARLVAIGAPDSELQSYAERARAPFIPVPRRRPAWVSLWGLTAPVLLTGRALGLASITETDIAEAASRLDADAERCRPTAETFTNPAKTLAMDLAGTIPVVWGSSRLATVAASRVADSLAANARYPASSGGLLEASRGRVGLLDGIYGSVAGPKDIFADPYEEDEEAANAPDPTRLRVVLLRDEPEEAGVELEGAEPVRPDSARADVVEDLATERGVGISVISAEGASLLERLASLIAVTDFASLYLALGHGIDPVVVPAVSELKERSARRPL